MKKFISLAISICIIACLLTGCVQSSQTIKLGFTGKSEANVTLTAENKLIKLLLVSAFGFTDNEAKVGEDGQAVASDTPISAKLLKAYTDQLNTKLTEVKKAYPDDINSYAVNTDLGDKTSSITISMKFDDFSQMTNSAFFNTFFSFCPITALEEETENAVYFAEKDGLFGKTYTFKGNADIKYVIDNYMSYFPTGDTSGYDKEGAKLTLKIASPYFVGNKTYVSTYSAPAAVNSTIFVINPIILAAAIIIIALIIALVLLALKLRPACSEDSENPALDQCCLDESIPEETPSSEDTENTENNEQ